MNRHHNRPSKISGWVHALHMSLHEVGLYGTYSDARRKGLEKGRLVGKGVNKMTTM
jgi:hypothetical protein